MLALSWLPLVKRETLLDTPRAGSQVIPKPATVAVKTDRQTPQCSCFELGVGGFLLSMGWDCAWDVIYCHYDHTVKSAQYFGDNSPVCAEIVPAVPVNKLIE